MKNRCPTCGEDKLVAINFDEMVSSTGKALGLERMIIECVNGHVFFFHNELQKE